MDDIVALAARYYNVSLIQLSKGTVFIITATFDLIKRLSFNLKQQKGLW
jgi:hypothetical protein